MNGGIDIRFTAEIYPDLHETPERRHVGEVIIELKTGKKKREHCHQTMCYLMTQFGLGAFANLGFVLYSDKDNLSSFLVKAVEPDLKYFLDIVLHRNRYMLNPKFFFDFQRCSDQAPGQEAQRKSQLRKPETAQKTQVQSNYF